MLLDQWMEQHKEKDCYPPTIINITDGEFNGASKDTVLQNANELKSMFTNDGNVILFNIHFTASKSSEEIICPIDKRELNGMQKLSLKYRVCYPCATMQILRSI